MINWIFFVFLGTFGWGCSLFFIKILLVVFQPEEIVFYRMIIGSLTLFVLYKFSNIKNSMLDPAQKLTLPGFRQERGMTAKIALKEGCVLGIFNIAMPFYLTAFAEKNISSALASVLNNLTPLFTYVFALCFLSINIKMSWINLLSVLLGLIGIIIMNVNFHYQSDQWIAVIALIVTSMSYAVGANYLKYFVTTQQPLLIAACSASVATLIMFFVGIFQAKIHWQLPHTFLQFFSLIWLGMMGSGICIYLYFLIIKQIGALPASMVTYLMTITGVSMGCIFLDETISLLSSVGCLCIILSLLVMHYTQVQQR